MPENEILIPKNQVLIPVKWQKKMFQAAKIVLQYRFFAIK